MAKLLRMGLLVLGAFATACGGSSELTETNDPPPPPPPQQPQVTLSTLSLDLTTFNLAAGDSATLLVEGVYSDGDVRDLTADVTWTSSNEVVAQFTAPGEIETVGPGVTTITAAYEGQSVSSELVVAPPRVASLALDPAEAFVSVDPNDGGGLRLRAIATYTDGTTADVTDQIPFEDWVSSNPTIGTMSAGDLGRLSLFGPTGELTLTARFEGQETTGTYVVTGPVIEQISVTPDAVRYQLGTEAVPLQVMGRMTDGVMVDVSADVTWSVGDANLVTIENGALRGLAEGETTFMATYTVTVGSISSELTATGSVRVVDPGDCPYPNFNPVVAYDDVIAPYEWVNGFDELGNSVDFSLNQAHCDPAIQTVAFIIGAGWCPFCPAFKEYVDGVSTELAMLGMKVVYIEIETDSGATASHEQANAIVNRTPRTGQSSRFGAFTFDEERPFSRVPALPNMVVVRTSDMKVIATGRQDILPTMAANPNQLYGRSW